MKFNIILSWSKVMALVITLIAAAIDFKMKLNGTVFMFSLPFVVFLLTGKQFIDWRKNTDEIKANGKK